MDPYYIFPKELWEMIFNRVEDPKDKLNFMRAHPDLRDQFGEKEEELQFLSALPILLSHLESSSCDGNCRKKREMLLSYRLISSSSCKVVDKWMESFWEKSEGHHKPPSSFCRDQDFMKRAALDKFLEHFSTHSRTPWLNRYASVWIPTIETADPILEQDFDHALALEGADSEKRGKVFAKIGSHLKKLDILLLVETGRVRELNLLFLDSLRNVLELTPNLRSLSLQLIPMRINPSTANQEILQFPELPQLDHLKLSLRGCNFNPFLNTFASIRKYFSQLVELEIDEVVDFQDPQELFPRMKSMKFEFFDYNKKSDAFEKKLRKFCRGIGAPKLITLEFDCRTWNVLITSGGDYQRRVETLMANSLVCLNTVNKFYSRMEPEYQWTGCVENVSGRVPCLKIKFSRKLN